MSKQKRLVEAIEYSGLTYSQFARLFGSSPRTLHSWLQGIPLPRRAVAALDNIEEVLSQQPKLPPHEMRDHLLNSSNGPSVFRKLLDAAPKNQQIQYNLP